MSGFDAFKEAPKPEDLNNKGDDQGNSLDEFRFSKVGEVKKDTDDSGKVAASDRSGTDLEDFSTKYTPEQNAQQCIERLEKCAKMLQTLDKGGAQHNLQSRDFPLLDVVSDPAAFQKFKATLMDAIKDKT